MAYLVIDIYVPRYLFIWTSKGLRHVFSSDGPDDWCHRTMPWFEGDD